jgi:hypothetical protein
MNRIRKYNGKYQVLITPYQKYNPGFEFLLGSWTDEGLMGFEVIEFDTYFEAESEAVKHPDINWQQLVDFHKDIFMAMKLRIQETIKYSMLSMDLRATLLTPEQTKDKMFDRVFKGQELIKTNQSDSYQGFRLIHDMNDIVCFTIINPWTKNLEEFEKHLLEYSRLNIFRKITKNSITHLIGRTDIGTTYEIILVPSILSNWMDWRKVNQGFTASQHLNALNSCIKAQRLVDGTIALR